MIQDKTNTVEKIYKRIYKSTLTPSENNKSEQETVYNRLKQAEVLVIEWMARNGLLLLRMSLGIIYFWFGILKFFPGLSPAELLAGQTISQLSFGYIDSAVSLPILATWECALGVGLMMSRGMRVILILLFLQMLGTFLPLVFFPDQTWIKLFVPTLEGQYIIKNILIVSSGIVLGGTLRLRPVRADKRTVKKH